MSAARTDDVVKLVLRLPKGLHRWLVQTAKRNNVSLNTEIINGLRGYETTLAKELRDRIGAAASASGRPLLQEIEYRLEQSLQREEADQLERALLERPAMAEDVRTLAAVGGAAGRYASLAAIQTEQGEAAAITALERYRQYVRHYERSTAEVEEKIWRGATEDLLGNEPEQKS
jgi:hypothetical protein